MPVLLSVHRTDVGPCMHIGLIEFVITYGQNVVS